MAKNNNKRKEVEVQNYRNVRQRLTDVEERMDATSVDLNNMCKNMVDTRNQLFEVIQQNEVTSKQVEMQLERHSGGIAILKDVLDHDLKHYKDEVEKNAHKVAETQKAVSETMAANKDEIEKWIKTCKGDILNFLRANCTDELKVMRNQVHDLSKCVLKLQTDVALLNGQIRQAGLALGGLAATTPMPPPTTKTTKSVIIGEKKC